MNHRQTTLLIGTSIIMAIGCTTETGEGFDSEMSEMEDTQDALVELGLTHDNQTIVVAFESMMPKDLLVRGEPVLIRELHSGLRMGTISVPANMDTADVVSELRQRADVRFAELDRVRTISAIADQDPGYSSQWNMHQIGTETAWDSGYDGSGIVVAVIDTGVSDGGTDGLSLTSGEQAGWDFVADDPDPSDAHGHGTHVAGTVAQRTGNGVGVAGVAHGAEIMAVRVLDANGSGYSSDVASGILWAVDHGADIINLSLGSSVGSQAEQEAVSYAAEHGVLVVAASGNEYQANGVSYPAAYAETLAVGASNGVDEVVAYSNRGPELDLVAPGGDYNRDDDGDGMVDGILQETIVNGQWDYYLFQGTSMASPHVAGAAAVLMGMGASADAAREILEVTALDVHNDGMDTTSGWGRLDLEAAVIELEYRLNLPDEDTPVVEDPIEDEPVSDEDPVEDTPVEEDPIVDEDPQDRDRPERPEPNLGDDDAPEFLYVNARRTADRVRVKVMTDEISAMMLCVRDTHECAKSPYVEYHDLLLHTTEAKLDLLAKDASGNTRVIPLEI